MKTFLVTGGCGFIGSHLCEALLHNQHRVRVLDDLSSGSTENLPPGAEFMRGDIACPETVRRALEGVQGCFHLAAIASVERGMQDWVGTNRVNLTGTIGLLEQIRRLPGSERIPFVYASSAAVYGDCDALPLTETCVARPLSGYGADKLACELHARVATLSHNIPTVGLRFFNVFGPRQSPTSAYSGVISIFCGRIRRGEVVEVFGDGCQTRDFIFVSDVVTGLVQAMTVCPPGAPVFNICTGRSTSVLQIAAAIADLRGVQLRTRLRPPRSGEVKHSVGSRAKAKPVLNLPDPIGLREGLAETLTWLDSAVGCPELGSILEEQ